MIVILMGAVLGPAAGCGSEPTPAPAPATGQPSAAPPPGPGELPGGLPHGERTLTGVVERSGECTLLRVGTRRWGLTGTPIDGLADGSRVTVVGQVTTADACAGPDVVRNLIVRRVTPG